MDVKLPENHSEFDIRKHSIIVGLGGSKSYGTNHPLSDTDWKGVLVAPRRYNMTDLYNFDQTTWKSEEKSGRLSEQAGLEEADEEGVIYGFNKFVKLCAACNPNVIELLFLREEDYAIVTDEGRYLIENRDLFLSQRALYTFTGYAMSQLKRIRTHKSWIDNPPTHKPTREEFGLPEHRALPNDQLQAARKLVTRHLSSLAPWLLDANNEHKEVFYEGLYNIVGLLAEESGVSLPECDSWLEIEEVAENCAAKTLGFDSNFMDYLRREKVYGQRRQQYKQYTSWLKNRNPARAEIESRYGYDCKHAMHLVRLLRMGEEILLTGNMNVYRPDRKELLEIRNGSWKYDYLVEWGDAKVEALNQMVREGAAVVPKTPKLAEIAEVSMEVRERFLARVGE